MRSRRSKKSLITAARDTLRSPSFSLAEIYKSQHKAAEGEKLIRSVVEHPTEYVSKEQATIALARYVATSDPAEARKLLEPLRTERNAISRVALNELQTLPAKIAAAGAAMHGTGALRFPVELTRGRRYPEPAPLPQRIPPRS